MRGQMVKDCTSWLAEVEGAQPSIVFAAKDGAGNDLDAVKVTIDGAPLTEKLTGTAVDVDPGQHVFRLAAATGATAERTVLVREGEKGRTIAVTLAARGSTLPPPPPAQGSASPRWPAYTAFSVAGAGLLLGAVFGAVALGDKHRCNAGTGPCPDADEWASDIGFGVAIAGAAVGAVLLATSGTTTKAASAYCSPWIGFGSAGVVGRFQ